MERTRYHYFRVLDRTFARECGVIYKSLVEAVERAYELLPQFKSAQPGIEPRLIMTSHEAELFFGERSKWQTKADELVNTFGKEVVLIRDNPQFTTWIQWKYWNLGDYAIAIVAVLDIMGQWAAYIGATDWTDEEEIAVQVAMEHGAKLYEDEATALFPQIANPYRS